MSSDSIFKRVIDRIVYKRSIGFGLEYVGLTTLRFPRIMALAVLAFSILALWQVPRANVDGDLLRVYAHSGRHYDAYEKLSQTFGTFENDIYVLVNSPRLVDPEIIEQVRNLAFDLELSDYAVGTMSPFTLRKPDGSGGSVPAVPEGMQTGDEVAFALMDLQQNDPMMRNLITPDLDGVVLILFPNQDMVRADGAKAMIDNLRATIAPYQGGELSIEITGPPVWTSEMLNAAVDDQIKFTIYGFGLGALIALFALRSLPGAILVATTPFIAVMWSIGTILMLFGSFSFLTIIVTTLVLVMAFAESMFFVFNWLAYWRDGMEPHKAVDATLKLVGPATSLTTLTTIVAFASLYFSPGQGVQEFALAGIAGCVIMFLCLMTVMPLLLKAALRLGFKLPKAPNFALNAPVPAALALATRFGRPIAVLAIVLTIALMIPAWLIQPRFSFEDYMTKDSSALMAAESIDQGVGGVAPIYVQVPLKEMDPNVGPEDFETIRKVHDIVESELGENKVISAASLTNYTESGFTREEVFNAVGPFMRKRFVTDDGGQALVTGFMPTIVESQALKDTVARIESRIAAEGIGEVEVGGFRVLTTFATDDIVTSLQISLATSIVLNLVLIGLAFGSWRVGLVSAIPNMFPILGTIAWLWFSHGGLQLTTMLALTIAFGVAVNDTIHMLSHYVHGRREEHRAHIDSVRHTMSRIGGAIVATTVILCAGTIIVAFSDLPQVALFGTLFVLSLVLALVGDLFILPALLVAGGAFFDTLSRLKVQTADHVATPDDPTGDTSTGRPGTTSM
ncbi:MAG: MMPL family transporter [Devosia sp.]|uniref:efflux RND transporter permease subunit n=1 Tax=Devosia sp. TaxID=1871048 RepID=UPI0024CB8AA9|nr:efflux RND transporter permease subunit [Devosia sp.]UYO00091.1 MAG: MMPL family transporter [Devosia sp.]